MQTPTGPTMSPRSQPDLTALELKGNDHVDDSFSMAMIAAATCFGLASNTAYDTVYCRSTNAFTPMINTAEDCTAHWACEGWLADKAMTHLAASLGLHAEKLVLPELDHEWGAARQHEARNQSATLIRQAMDAGAVVLITGGWDIGFKEVNGQWQPAGPHGFVFWGAAGLITHADPATGTILGAHPNGYRDNPIIRLGNMWALTRAPEGPTAACNADLETLRLAIDRIRSQTPFQTAGHAVYGVAAMNVWADHMAKTPGFCASCFAQGPQASVGDALDNGARLNKAAGMVASFLRSLCDTLPPPTHPQLEVAAVCYDRIKAMLAPVVTPDGPDFYATWLGDMDRQRAHADVLRDITAELLGAANALEQVLWIAERRPAQLRRDGNRVWLEGVPLGKASGNGYIRGLESMLASAGTPVSYERLMGLSGLAFIVQADTEHRWEGKIDVGWWPLDPWGLLLRRQFLGRAVGHEIREIGWNSLTSEQYLALRDRLPEVYRGDLAPQVKRAIDAGQPLLATCDFGFVVTGYDDAASQPPVLGRCARETTDTLGRPSTWPIGMLVLGETTPPLDTNVADVAALRYAVALAHDAVGPDEPGCWDCRFTGKKAWAAWSALLRDPEQAIEDHHQANMKQNLRWNRSAAVAYLQTVAKRQHGAAATALLEAAAAYETGLAVLAQLEPDGLAGNPQARRQAADLVDRIAMQEQSAVQAMEKALAEMPVTSENGEAW